ncbi:MAG: glycosyltransferase [Holophagales bacterium]|nr:glycosyltransferase [Holophagales bacterium]
MAVSMPSQGRRSGTSRRSSSTAGRPRPARASWPVATSRSSTSGAPDGSSPGGPQRGVDRSRGRLLVFTDPDVYAAPDWLERLVAAHGETGNVVVGALACHGSRWLDRGIHLCKFSKWLPAGERRPVDMSPTANMLVPAALFDEMGRFHGDMLMGDTTLSRNLLAAGRTLLFEPRAVVAHHHMETLRSFARERWRRRILFGRLRGSWMQGRKACSSRCCSRASCRCASPRTSPTAPCTPPAPARSVPSCRRSPSSSSASARRSWERRRATRKRFSAPRVARTARRR